VRSVERLSPKLLISLVTSLEMSLVSVSCHTGIYPWRTLGYSPVNNKRWNVTAAGLIIADPARLRLVVKRCALVIISSSLCFASRIYLLDATYSSTWKCTHLPRNLVHLQVYGTYFQNKFTTVKSSLFESERNSLLLFCLVIFTCTDICEDQAKSDGVDCTVSNRQSSFSVKFGRNYVVVTLSAILDRRARIPRQDIGNKRSAKRDLMKWNS